MALPHTAAIPPGLDLPDGFVIRFRAISPTTGADVAGVKISNAMLVVTAFGTGELDSGAFQLVPGPGA